ncbi:DNA internalization-related competence protein ComEC/Rec2 [Shewanella pealeana]|uniref:DNA internalization-related competence protein ComEC/Rec2 n=1 Tax=Shewanella pealeana (strain ATCC 700345 / ANG-SQ1) TaxID=398579 RepID=A8H3F5_SHEPA|nr:DNA internalization-related competence protein ComEC/Rec2 [Shewanella pealeana]ABV87092.1 DNA internalization-related competence protein ComEC/Rec2 [Shewanella pealeana ATCC 700345]
MNRFMCGYCVTIVSTMLWPALANLYLLPLLIVVVITACKRVPFIAGGLFAICWISLFYALLMGWDTDERVDTLNVEGEIVSLVHTNGDWISMDIVLIDSISPHLFSRKLRLTWKEPPSLTPGQHWLLTIKPRPITSTLNQGSYNQQKNLLAKHIIGKGRVVSGKLLSHEPNYRTQLIAELKHTLKTHASGDLLLALVAGDRTMISAERWQQLRNTGAGHLFAISGLHLSVVSLWLLIGARFLLYRYSAVNSRRNWLLCLTLSAVGAVAYAYLAGFSVSTQRAMIMLLAFICFSVLQRHSSSWERLLYALFVVLLMDPLSMLSASFWLSFSALGIILLTVTRHTFTPKNLSASLDSGAMAQANLSEHATLWLKFRNACVAFWAVQWRLTLGLCLVQAIFFSGTSLVSLAVNLLLVPWFTLLVIPLCLLSLLVFIFATSLGLSAAGIFWVAAKSMVPVTAILNYSSQFEFVWLALSDQVIAALMVAFIGLYLTINVKDILWRLVLSVMLMPLLLMNLFMFAPIEDKRWQVHLLDVGQGLSLVIEKGNRAIIYDTGARYGDSFSYAERVVLPFLISQGIEQLDYLVVSHGDNDHAGGAEIIIQRYPKTLLISDLDMGGESALASEFDHKFAHEIALAQQYSCRPKILKWQNLTLEVLAPSEAREGNNGSCVIRVNDASNSVLLSGDIEKLAERALLGMIEEKGKADGENNLNLQSRLLIAPHHGSKTSSTEAFIDAVSPELVLFPAGFKNRYRFPNSEVVLRYHQRGIATLTSGEQGQISIIFNQQTMKIRTYRSDFAPFWYNQVFRFGQINNPE